ncbi:hypothetical protein [Carboxydothermus ferrireducens]|uniref:Uncharacterized protein n=1 Tax=Carboxydothermus ferrireducens DSM 11255 TaxID=1119529 RepID=A0ABX2R7J1_9THEO|nr:hypothetical protein [Carboxydothermus ferrireducens]NYE57134.1 hypothetical protein [Carboxydothermus ferrireducens DSM 11255]
MKQKLLIKSVGEEVHVNFRGSTDFLKSAFIMTAITLADILLNQDGLSQEEVIGEFEMLISSALTIAQGGVLVEEKQE